jgi:hypothetical protein
VCRSKHAEPSINFGIINSITKLHLVGISTEKTENVHKQANVQCNMQHKSVTEKRSVMYSNFITVWATFAKRELV